MASTLLLDRSTWDLVLDASGNIAVAAEPYSLAQDAASAIKTFLGEWYWNTTVGVPYLTQVFGIPSSVNQLSQILQTAALRVPDVSAVKVVLSTLQKRTMTGQVQVTSSSTGETSVASFTVINPQGG